MSVIVNWEKLCVYTESLSPMKTLVAGPAVMRCSVVPFIENLRGAWAHPGQVDGHGKHSTHRQLTSLFWASENISTTASRLRHLLVYPRQ